MDGGIQNGPSGGPGIIAKAFFDILPVQQPDSGFCGNVCQTVVQGIQIPAVMLRKGKGIGKGAVQVRPGANPRQSMTISFISGISIQQFKAFIVVIGIVNQAVIGKDNPFGAPAAFA